MVLHTSGNALDEQIRVLKQIKLGERPVSDLALALNHDILVSASTDRQDARAAATLQTLSDEQDRLERQIAFRESQISSINNDQTESNDQTKIKYNSQSLEQPLEQTLEQKKLDLSHKHNDNERKTQAVSKLLGVVKLLLDRHVQSMLRLPPDQLALSQTVLQRLVEVGLKGEQLIVPKNLEIVNYLLENGLILLEPCSAKSVRIRIL